MTDSTTPQDDAAMSPASDGSVANSQANLDGWILVAERLPEVDDVYLCFAEGQSRPFLAFFGEDGWQSLDVYDYDRGGECTAETPTHWRPLPAPPSDGK